MHTPYAGMPRTLGAFKAEGLSIIREYFDSSDAGEVGRRCVYVCAHVCVC